MIMNYDRNLSVRCTREDWNLWQQAAAERGMKLSTLVRTLMNQYMIDKEVKVYEHESKTKGF